jgi:hypothetical protein
VINKINRIGEIQLLTNISNIDVVKEISLIKRIADAPWIANLGVAMNGDFETGNLVGWVDPGGVATVTDEKPNPIIGSKYSCKLKFSDKYGIIQYYYPPILIDDIIQCTIHTLQGDLWNDMLMVTFYFTDGTSAGFSVPSNRDNYWNYHDLLPQIRDLLPSVGGKYFYAIKLQNYVPGGTAKDTLYIDDFTMLTMPVSRLEQRSALLNDVSVTVPPATAEPGKAWTPYAGYVSITPKQVLTLSFEYTATGPIYNMAAEAHIVWLNADRSVNSETKFGISVPTEWVKKAFTVVVPDGVAYASFRGYGENKDGVYSGTIYFRNIKFFPVTRVKECRDEVTNATLAAGGSLDVDVFVPDNFSGVAVTLKATYNASATAAVQIEIYNSQDGTNWDSDTDDIVVHPFAPGATKQKTYIFAAACPYIRLRVKNLDATYAATVSLWRTFI